MLCIRYTRPDMKYIDEARQVIINSDRLDDETIDEFIGGNPNRFVYIDAKDEVLTRNLQHMRKLQELKKYDNWTLQFSLHSILFKDGDCQKVDLTKFNAIKDCCNRYMFTELIGQWEILQFVLSLNPSEVYLTNILGFSLGRAKMVCDAAGVGIRLYANWAQSAWDGTPAINKFFIRPEDVKSYEPFVSGIEFQGNANVQEVMYQVYKRGYWYGDLNEIIIGLNEHIDSRRLPVEFGEHRANCGKRCITGSHCHLCRVMNEFAQRLEKTNGVIKHE